MNDELLKQNEWEEHASLELDSAKQILRPVTMTHWRLLADDIVTKLDLDDGEYNFLDVGCGNAFLTSFFEHKLKKITGVDYAPSMIAKAKENISRGSFSVGSASQLEFQDGQFDRTLCYSIFHYLKSYQQALRAIDELVRVTQRGGVILIGDLLDKTKEHEIKSSSDLEIEASLPLIKRYSEWLFIDLDHVLDYLSNRGLKAEILSQPDEFPASEYRKDLKIYI